FCWLAPPKYGQMYSHTIVPSTVTSKMRPVGPEVMSVLPLGSRCAPLMLVAKKRGLVYDQTNSSVAGLISSTRDVGRVSAPRPSGAIGLKKPYPLAPPLSNTSRFPSQ